ncbi:MAG: hypothetical protein ABIK15_09740 [Pseudomonadota bacterium]
MKKIFIIILLSVIFTGICTSSCMAGWLFFSKPEFKGRILDAETQEPIEGAVVVAVYNTRPIIGGPGGKWTSVINVREALTDEKGEFCIPSYYTIINPFSEEYITSFIIYKPGYMSYSELDYHPDYSGTCLEDFFAREIGESAEALKSSVTMEKIVTTYGVVELLRRETREERLRAQPSTPTDIGADELPLLFKAINEENKRFGRGEVKY